MKPCSPLAPCWDGCDLLTEFLSEQYRYVELRNCADTYRELDAVMDGLLVEFRGSEVMPSGIVVTASRLRSLNHKVLRALAMISLHDMRMLRKLPPWHGAEHLVDRLCSCCGCSRRLRASIVGAIGTWR